PADPVFHFLRLCLGAPWLHLSIDHCFDAVSIGIENESSKIIRPVFRMQPHPSIIAPALFQRGPIKRRHRLSRRRAKSNMESVTWRDHSLGTKSQGKFILGSG